MDLEFGYLLALVFGVPVIAGIAWGFFGPPSPNWQKPVYAGLGLLGVSKGVFPLLLRTYHFPANTALLWMSPLLLVGGLLVARSVVHLMRFERARKQAEGPSEEELRAQAYAAEKPQVELARPLLDATGMPMRRP
jgi:hypothetical protein